MSVKIMGMVWDSNLPRNEKFVLLAYADHADHEGGSIFPAVAKVAKKTGYDERMVQRITRKLEEKGIMVLEGASKYSTNLYHIDTAILAECTTEQDTPPAKCHPSPRQNATRTIN